MNTVYLTDKLFNFAFHLNYALIRDCTQVLFLFKHPNNTTSIIGLIICLLSNQLLSFLAEAYERLDAYFRLFKTYFCVIFCCHMTSERTPITITRVIAATTITIPFPLKYFIFTFHTVFLLRVVRCFAN